MRNASAKGGKGPLLRRAKRWRQGGVRAEFEDGCVLRVAADGLSARFQPGMAGGAGPSHEHADDSAVSGAREAGADESFATVSTADSRGGHWLPVEELPEDAGRYLESLRSYLSERRARESR